MSWDGADALVWLILLSGVSRLKSCRPAIRIQKAGPEAGVLVRKLSQLTPLSYAKHPRHSYCSVESAVSLPAVYTGLLWTLSRLRPNQTLVSYTLAGSAELSRLSSISPLVPFYICRLAGRCDFSRLNPLSRVCRTKALDSVFQEGFYEHR